jgi:hypothetical protein
MDINTLLFIFMLLTTVVLLGGIALMVRGGKLNRKFSVKLMGLRVIFQGIALAVIAFMLLSTQA